MAKGFTVKANAPTKKKEEWDIEAIKERMRGKAIVFCLPGRGCSFTFLKNFVQLCFDVLAVMAPIRHHLRSSWEGLPV